MPEREVGNTGETESKRLLVLVPALQFGALVDGLQIGFPKPGCYPCPSAK